jgi:hypothetical protein
MHGYNESFIIDLTPVAWTPALSESDSPSAAGFLPASGKSVQNTATVKENGDVPFTREVLPLHRF